MTGSPVRLVTAIFAGGILAAFSILFGRQAHFHHVLIVPVVAGLLGGYAILLLAGQRLRTGISRGRWTEEQLLPLRRLIEARWWTPVLIALLTAVCCCVVFLSKSRGPFWAFFVFFWAFFILMQALYQVTWSFSSPSLRHR